MMPAAHTTTRGSLTVPAGALEVTMVGHLKRFRYLSFWTLRRPLKLWKSFEIGWESYRLYGMYRTAGFVGTFYWTFSDWALIEFFFLNTETKDHHLQFDCPPLMAYDGCFIRMMRTTPGIHVVWMEFHHSSQNPCCIWLLTMSMPLFTHLDGADDRASGDERFARSRKCTCHVSRVLAVDAVICRTFSHHL